MTLKEMLKFVKSKESDKCSSSRLHDSKGSQAAASSTYNQLRQQTLKDCLSDSDGEPKLCSYVAGKVMDRSLCPAPEKMNALPISTHVSSAIDQDVGFGIIEPVPAGKPVTWCHCMVECPKKNGKPCRTLDFQALSLHATQETITPSPHSTRHNPSPMAPRKQSLTRGMDITVSPSIGLTTT